MHYIIGVDPGRHPEPNLAALEAEIAEASLTWDDRFEQALRRSGLAPEQAADILRRYGAAFPPGYRDLFGAQEALADIAVMDATGADPIKVRAYRTPTDTSLQFRFKLYREGEPAPLSDLMPILENMGLKGLIEEGLEVRRQAPDGAVSTIWVHDVLLQDDGGDHLVFEEIKEPFESAFLAVWTGRTENDGFNRLVLELGVSWREAALVRALARYRQQSGLDPSQAVQTAALSEFPGVARLILDLFRTRFDPAMDAGWPSWSRPSSGPTTTSWTRRASRRATSPSRSPAASSTTFPTPSRSGRSSSGLRTWKRCTCASAPSPAAASAGRTVAMTSAPKCSAWPRPSR